MTDDKDEDAWVISSTHETTNTSVEEFLGGEPVDIAIDEEESSEQNPLEGQLAQWGMSIPPKIDDELEDDDFGPAIPNIIEDSQGLEGAIVDHLGVSFVDSATERRKKTAGIEQEETQEHFDLSDLSSSEVDSADEVILPDQDDLAYPSLEEDTSSSEDTVQLDSMIDDDLKDGEETLDNNFSPNSSLVSLDELSQEVAEEEEEETDPSFEMTSEIKNELEDEIRSEAAPDDFWATDEFPSISNKEDHPTTEVQSSAQLKDDFFKDLGEDELEDQSEDLEARIIRPSSTFSSIKLSDVGAKEEATNIKGAQINEEELVERVKESLEPLIEKIVRDLFQEKIEKIAWEVIPDLAENIIKTEVEEIAKKVYLSKDSE